MKGSDSVTCTFIRKINTQNFELYQIKPKAKILLNLDWCLEVRDITILCPLERKPLSMSVLSKSCCKSARRYICLSTVRIRPVHGVPESVPCRIFWAFFFFWRNGLLCVCVFSVSDLWSVQNKHGIFQRENEGALLHRTPHCLYPSMHWASRRSVMSFFSYPFVSSFTDHEESDTSSSAVFCYSETDMLTQILTNDGELYVDFIA